MKTPAFEDRSPNGFRVTVADERHLATYSRLLDADAEGADWRKVVSVILGLGAEQEPVRAKIVHDNHLARACRMIETGCRDLPKPRLQ